MLHSSRKDSAHYSIFSRRPDIVNVLFLPANLSPISIDTNDHYFMAISRDPRFPLQATRKYYQKLLGPLHPFQTTSTVSCVIANTEKLIWI